ncbi:hypothetical protein DENSPDRAFT_934618, partial [Dentipellis sp. KUC8613]
GTTKRATQYDPSKAVIPNHYILLQPACTQCSDRGWAWYCRREPGGIRPCHPCAERRVACNLTAVVTDSNGVVIEDLKQERPPKKKRTIKKGARAEAAAAKRAAAENKKAKGKGKARATTEDNDEEPPAKRTRGRTSKVFKSAEYVNDSEEELAALQQAVAASRN